jgi:hypothetical protein
VTRILSQVVWGASWSFLLAVGPACAQPARLAIELDGCAALTEPRLRELVELELGTLRIAAGGSTLRVGCDAGSAVIRLRRASGAWFPIEVRVELRETEVGARSRLVALAATELLAGAARSDEVKSAAPPPSVPVSPAAAPARDEERERGERRRSTSQRVALHATATVAIMGDPATTLAGGSLGAALAFTHRWSLLLETGYAGGVAHASPTEVRWSSWSAFVGPLATFRPGPLLLGAALGLRGGRLSLHANATRPDAGRSLVAPWLGIAVPLRLEAELVGALRGLLSLEAGYVLSPVRGNDDAGQVIASHRGVWGTLGAGAALGF